MTRTLIVLLLSCASLACGPAHLAAYRFRTMQPDTALQRTTTAMQLHGEGVGQTRPAQGLVYSRWKHTDFRYGLKKITYRFSAAVIPDPSDGSASVTLGVQILACGPLDRTRPDEELEQHCAAGEIVPGFIKEDFERFKQAMKKEIYRWD